MIEGTEIKGTEIKKTQIQSLGFSFTDMPPRLWVGLLLGGAAGGFIGSKKHHTILGGTIGALAGGTIAFFTGDFGG